MQPAGSVSQAVVIATGVTADGRREVLGFDVGDSEDGAFWTAFLRCAEGPRPGRGAAGHLRRPHRAEGTPSPRCCIGAAWQRCRVHFMRNVLARGPEGQRRRWSPPRSARSSPNPTPSTSASSSTSSRPCSAASSPRSRRCCATPHDDLLAFTDFPRRALEEDLVDQPARAAQQGDQTPHRRRRDLPQPRRAAPPRRRRPGRGPRRMAGHADRRRETGPRSRTNAVPLPDFRSGVTQGRGARVRAARCARARAPWGVLPVFAGRPTDPRPLYCSASGQGASPAA